MMVGLQGSGKTTTCAKLARLLMENGKRVLLVAADLQRPAAIEQLKILGESVGAPVFHQAGIKPPELCARLIPSNAAVCDNNFVLDYFRFSADHRMLFGGCVSYTTRTPANLPALGV